MVVRDATYMFVSFYVVQYCHIYVYFILLHVHVILLLSVIGGFAKNGIDELSLGSIFPGVRIHSNIKAGGLVYKRYIELAR